MAPPQAASACAWDGAGAPRSLFAAPQVAVRFKEAFVIRKMVVCSLLLAACGVERDAETDAETAELGGELAPPHRRVVPGAGLQLLEVTDDNDAIYQAGQQVFAAPLGSSAAPVLISDVPAGNTAFVFRVGRVAFVWTNPDRTLPGFGVSPLVIWSARGGAHLASQASAIGTLAVSASRDGGRVLFTSNADPNGTTGDLVLASADLTEQTTVAAGVAMGFPSGPCVPRATFHGPGDDLSMVFCAAGSATATLAQWLSGVRRDLAQPLFAPPRMVVDPDTGRAATLLAGSRFPIAVDRRGEVTVLAQTAAVNVSLGGDGAVLYTVPPDASGLRGLFRVRGPQPPRQVAQFLGLHTFLSGSTALTQPITSPDGRQLLYFDAIDPSLGLATDVVLGDARGVEPPVVLDASAATAVFAAPFTRDSQFALFARLDTSTFAVGSMFVHGRGGTRQFSDAAGWQWNIAFGSTITYNDHTALDLTNPLASVADLKVVDVARHELEPRLIVRGANVTYLASHRGTGVVYTLDSGPAPGLYVARVR